MSEMSGLVWLTAVVRTSSTSNLLALQTARVSSFLARFCTLLYTILFAACPLPTHPTNIEVEPARYCISAHSAGLIAIAG